MQTIELNHTKKDNLLMIPWQINQICNWKAPTHPSSKHQLEPDMEQKTGSKLGKEYIKAVYCHPAYLTYMQSTSHKMPGWMKHKLESRLLAEISITSDDITLWQKLKKN